MTPPPDPTAATRTTPMMNAAGDPDDRCGPGLAATLTIFGTEVEVDDPAAAGSALSPPVVVGPDFAVPEGRTVLAVAPGGRDVLVGADLVGTSVAFGAVTLEGGEEDGGGERVVDETVGVGAGVDAGVGAVVVVVAGGGVGPGLVARTALGRNGGWLSVPAILVPPKVQASTLPGCGSKLMAPCWL
jgi:hypothetical protein